MNNQLEQIQNRWTSIINEVYEPYKQYKEKVLSKGFDPEDKLYKIYGSVFMSGINTIENIGVRFLNITLKDNSHYWYFPLFQNGKILFKFLEIIVDNISPIEMFKTILSEYENSNITITIKNTILADTFENENNRLIFDLFEYILYISKLPVTEQEKTLENLQKEIVFLNSIKVNNLLIPNTKVANQLTTGNLYNELTEVVVSGNKTKEVTTKVILNYEGVTLTGRREVTAYDRVVHNALLSVKKAGNKNFTPATVYRVMNGLTERDWVRPQAIAAVTNSIDKLLVTRAKIDFTDEAIMHHKNIQNATLEGFLIEARKIEIKAGGEIVSGYEFISEKDPILYSHAQVSGQIYTIPIKLLKTKSKVRGTEEVIIIREYLIRQIEWIKSNKSKRSPNITYKSIYEELGISQTDLNEKAYKEKTFKIRSHTKALLASWKEKEVEYIKDYKEYKEGYIYKGITITV
jgi:hypothetical protein